MNQNLKIDPYGFREYDARWLYEKDINLAGIENLGKGFGSQIIKNTKKNNPRVIVGHDYRSYSEEIKFALKKGLISTGCFIEDVGLSLSPMVYFAQFNLNWEKYTVGERHKPISFTLHPVDNNPLMKFFLTFSLYDL